MSNTKKPAFNADAAEEYFSDLLFYYKKTGDDIFNRDNEGRHSTNFIYSAEYQKYVGMQIAMREVLEYFSKYDLADVQEILGDNYDLDRLRELVEADRDGRCEIVPEVMFQVDNSERVYQLNIRKIIYDTGPGNIAFDKDAIGKSIFHTREAAEAALKGRCQNENF